MRTFSRMPWEFPVAAGAALLGALALSLVVLVTGATDEGGVAWSLRVAHALPVAPLCGALGAWLSPLSARRRGDERGLAALGVSPWRVALPAALGAFVVPFAAAVYLAGFADPAQVGPSFFPRIERTLRFEADPAGPMSFVSEDGRLRVWPSGKASLTPSSGAPAPGEATGYAGREALAAAFTTALAGLAFAWVAARGASPGRISRMALLAATAFASLLVFQAAGAGRVPVLAPLAPPLVFLLGLAFSDARAHRHAVGRQAAARPVARTTSL